jgi:hypothetical protein
MHTVLGFFGLMLLGVYLVSRAVFGPEGALGCVGLLILAGLGLFVSAAMH